MSSKFLVEARRNALLRFDSAAEEYCMSDDHVVVNLEVLGVEVDVPSVPLKICGPAPKRHREPEILMAGSPEPEPQVSGFSAFLKRFTLATRTK